MIGVVDFGSGNLRSVVRGLDAIGADAVVIRDGAQIKGMERLVLPGVGAAGHAMRRLEERGLADGMRAWCADGRPLLGICLGAQLLLDRSEEDGAAGLGLLAGTCRRFPQPGAGGPRHVPHLGWSRVELPSGGLDAYFAHAYYLDPVDTGSVAGWTELDGFRFASVLRHGRIVGFQFHPEKSGPAGRSLLRAWTAGLLDS